MENVFGICASRFRIFRRPIIAQVDTFIAVTKAVVALHNFLMFGRSFENNSEYCPADYTDEFLSNGDGNGRWRLNHGLVALNQAGSNNYSREAKLVRDDFRDYFNSSEGSVPWQWDIVRSTINPFDKL